MSDDDDVFLCTTMLEYADRYEGQVLHVGDKESCERVSKDIPCLVVGELALASHIVVIPRAGHEDIVPGTFWRNEKKKAVGG